MLERQAPESDQDIMLLKAELDYARSLLVRICAMGKAAEVGPSHALLDHFKVTPEQRANLRLCLLLAPLEVVVEASEAIKGWRQLGKI